MEQLLQEREEINGKIKLIERGKRTFQEKLKKIDDQITGILNCGFTCKICKLQYTYLEELNLHEREMTSLQISNEYDLKIFNEFKDAIHMRNLTAVTNLANIYPYFNFNSYVMSGTSCYSILYYAVTSSNLNVLKFFIDNGADPSLNHADIKESPLGNAVRTQSLEMVELLLKYYADPNIVDKHDKGISIGQYALIRREPDILTILLEYGMDPNLYSGTRPLVMACAGNRYPRLMEILLEKGADINKRDINGKSIYQNCPYKEITDIITKFATDNNIRII